MADVYLILGAEGAGRREAVRDLIEGGFDDNEVVDVACANSEPALPGEQIADRANTRIFSYAELSMVQAPDDAETLFLIAPGRANPLDVIEDFADWLRVTGHNLIRIITMVHCQLLSSQPKLEIWHRACIHFSDVVLLNRREGVPNKWFTEFRGFYEQEHYPCLIEIMKKGHVRNPALILESQPRRLSLAFDMDIDPVDLIDFDENNLPEETIDLTRPTDPWLIRLPSGHWEKRLPDIARFMTEGE